MQQALGLLEAAATFDTNLRSWTEAPKTKSIDLTE